MTGYQIDLDPVHTVIRLTVTEEIVTPELAQEMYTRLQEISSTRGEYAAIYDLTMVKGTTIEVEVVRSMARNRPAVLLRRSTKVQCYAPENCVRCRTAPIPHHQVRQNDLGREYSATSMSKLRARIGTHLRSDVAYLVATPDLGPYWASIVVIFAITS